MHGEAALPEVSVFSGSAKSRWLIAIKVIQRASSKFDLLQRGVAIMDHPFIAASTTRSATRRHENGSPSKRLFIAQSTETSTFCWTVATTSGLLASRRRSTRIIFAETTCGVCVAGDHSRAPAHFGFRYLECCRALAAMVLLSAIRKLARSLDEDSGLRFEGLLKRMLISDLRDVKERPWLQDFTGLEAGGPYGGSRPRSSESRSRPWIYRL